jgi:hypothetical protein
MDSHGAGLGRNMKEPTSKHVLTLNAGDTHLQSCAQEAELRRIVVRNQPWQVVHKTLSRKTLDKKRAGGVAQGEGPEFKLQYHKKKKVKYFKFQSHCMP